MHHNYKELIASLKAFGKNLIDYAGLFPPASLNLAPREQRRTRACAVSSQDSARIEDSGGHGRQEEMLVQPDELRIFCKIFDPIPISRLVLSA